jgi:hypothetical protein
VRALEIEGSIVENMNRFGVFKTQVLILTARLNVNSVRLLILR